MSYDIELCDPVTNQVIEFNNIHELRGGTYALNNNRAELNITWNYGKLYYSIMGDKGIRTIYGLSGAESIIILKAAIDKLGSDIDSDYWKPTEGNAKRALQQLLVLATLCPDGIWTGD